MSCDALTISKRFALEGEPVDAKPYGCGHINDTYCVCCRREGNPQRRYILQRVNKNVFANVPELMDNMIHVTAFLKERVLAEGGDPDRECLQLVPTKDGALYLQDEEGQYWRCFVFIERRHFPDRRQAGAFLLFRMRVRKIPASAGGVSGRDPA